MARPKKQGLDYFPFDCDFFSDERMVAIAGKYGIEGEIVTVKLLCAIYRRGYYLEWNEMVKYKLLSQLPGVGASRLDEIVTRLVLWGFFDKALYDSDNVLTSKSIQEVYFEASKFRKLDGELPYLLEKPRSFPNINPYFTKAKQGSFPNINCRFPTINQRIPRKNAGNKKKRNKIK